MAQGTKRGRGSPKLEEGKDIFEGVVISDEIAKKLETMQRDTARVELAIERDGQKKLMPIFEKRRELLKSIPNFWSVALIRHSLLSFQLAIGADQDALSYLEDLWVEKDPRETRCFKIDFYFKENPYFANKVLTKEFKFVPPPADADDKPDENGITNANIDFSWEKDVKIGATTIDWKNAEKHLTKLYPRVMDTEEDDQISEPGSFFHFFEQETDPMDVGVTIANDIFSEAIEYFLGTASGVERDLDDDDEDEDDEDDDDDDAEEIDLEKPQSKKRRV
ncbi:hypothetical protein Agabi119p4_867 [Agaricus bisporus var. burnettii]|uniref:Template-activating factor I n=1 Tax=Agaricus bisporus var. burnettii TaxID=192524 RepID=A0A8H7FBC8_AGABI|nr:hypothetical protein Agabi119p4_867 [Agaricus bisporus var. burnettii]